MRYEAPVLASALVVALACGGGDAGLDASHQDATVDLDASASDAGDTDAGDTDAGPETCVHVSTYGAVGDGTTDDTAAIQEAYDNEDCVAFEPGADYRITGTIDWDRAGDQYTRGDGASLVVTSGYIDGPAINIDKASGVAYVAGLDVDGNSHLRVGYDVNSSYSITDLSIVEIYAPAGENGTAAGIAVDLNERDAESSRVFTESLIRGVTIDGVVAESTDCAVAGTGAGDGNAKGIQMKLWGATVPNSFRIEDTTVTNVWGDDADVLDLFQTDNFDTYTGQNYIIRSHFSNGNRRVAKARIANTTFIDSTFTEPASTNPDVHCRGVAVSLIAISRPSYSPPAYIPNVRFLNCDFYGDDSDFYDKDIVIIDADDTSFEGCRFHRVPVYFRQNWGNTHFIGNEFDADSYLDDYNIYDGWSPGAGYSDCNNVKRSTPWDRLVDSGTPQSCLVSCYDGTRNGDETDVDCGGDCGACP